MAYVMVFVVALILGLIAEGYGHALVLFGAVVGVLMVGFFFVAAVVGIVQGVKEKTAGLRAAAELKAAEAHRAMREESEAQAKSAPYDPEKFVLVPVAVFKQWAALNPEAVTAAPASPEGGVPGW